MYEASLLVSEDVRQSATDIWINVKIPLVRSLARSRMGQSEWWYDSIGNNATYSSILGVPVFGIPSEGNSTFHSETSYVDVSCFNIG
jgi:hypothetical protein